MASGGYWVPSQRRTGRQHCAQAPSRQFGLLSRDTLLGIRCCFQTSQRSQTCCRLPVASAKYNLASLVRIRSRQAAVFGPTYSPYDKFSPVRLDSLASSTACSDRMSASLWLPHIHCSRNGGETLDRRWWPKETHMTTDVERKTRPRSSVIELVWATLASVFPQIP